jgi:hypothetical protein
MIFISFEEIRGVAFISFLWCWEKIDETMKRLTKLFFKFNETSFNIKYHASPSIKVFTGGFERKKLSKTKSKSIKIPKANNHFPKIIHSSEQKNRTKHHSVKKESYKKSCLEYKSHHVKQIFDEVTKIQLISIQFYLVSYF